MATTNYSHAFLVGSFNGNISPELLRNDKRWFKEVVTLNGEVKRYDGDKGYNGLCTLYYKAHLDAMLEANDIKRPKFLQTVHHYIHNLEDKNGQGCEIMLPVSKGRYPNKTAFEYKFRLCKLHLYFFPLNFVLFAIEIDDSLIDLDDLTAAHSYLMGYWDSTAFDNPNLLKCIEPLTSYLPQEKPCRLTKDGNKLKIFQTIKIDTNEINDELLYEIGTSCPIGCVKDGQRPDMKPAESYFRKIIDENAVASFDNWRGLALVDSFTMLGKADSFYEDDCNYLYFPLIYLRCLFEKTFCFSRNNAFREDKAGKRLIWEIEQMEKYYFYDNISYNFQPNLLYKAMAKGLSIKEEREVLSKQIKDQEEKRFDKILAYVAIFAVFSVVWDICSISMKAFPYLEKCFSSQFASICILGGLIIASLFVYQISKRRYRNLFSFFPSLYGKVHQYFCIAHFKKVVISQDARKHMETHFQHDSPGSKFYSSSPDILIEEAMRLFPETFKNAKTDADGRIRISLSFPGKIGVSNVVSIEDLTEEEKDRIEIVDRQGKKVRSIKTNREIPTKECHIILSSDWNLITMFPGELAPPLPDSPEIHDDYWDNHVFIEPESK